jgi:hypothetical protein
METSRPDGSLSARSRNDTLPALPQRRRAEVLHGRQRAPAREQSQKPAVECGQTAAPPRLQKPTPPGISRTSSGQQAPDGSPSKIRDRWPMICSDFTELAQAGFPRRSQSPRSERLPASLGTTAFALRLARAGLSQRRPTASSRPGGASRGLARQASGRRHGSRSGPIGPAAYAPKEISGHRRRGSELQTGITVCRSCGASRGAVLALGGRWMLRARRIRR